MFVFFLHRKDFSRCALIALSLFAPVLVTAQINSRPGQQPGVDQPEILFDRPSLRRELENLQAQLAAHPNSDEVRANMLTEMASLQSRLGYLLEAQRSSQAVLFMPIQLAPEYLGVNHFVLAN